MFLVGRIDGVKVVMIENLKVVKVLSVIKVFMFGVFFKRDGILS